MWYRQEKDSRGGVKDNTDTFGFSGRKSGGLENIHEISFLFALSELSTDY